MPPTKQDIFREIHSKFGFLPPFFEVGACDPIVLGNLWYQTQTAYLENPIPSAFLERLFAYLSRFCEVPYCLVCHSCFLRPLGMRASDVLALLEQPPPDREEINDLVAMTNVLSTGLEVWPRDRETEQVIFRLSVLIYLKDEHSAIATLMLRRLLAAEWFDRLIMFLGYVKICGIWIDSHPELSYEADRRFQDHFAPTVQDEPRLTAFFATYRERVAQENRSRILAEPKKILARRIV